MTRQVVWEGDSITYGSFATLPFRSIVQTDLGIEYYTNVSEEGDTIAGMLSDAAATVDAIIDPSYDRCIAVLLGGLNDLIAGTSKTTIYNNIVSWCQGRQAAGYQVVIQTILPYTYGTDREDDRHWINVQIRENWRTFADALSNIDGDSDLQDLDTYYVDHVHPNDAGHAIIAGYVEEAILSLDNLTAYATGSIFVTVGTTQLWTGALNSVYDASLNSALDSLLNSALDATSSIIQNESGLLIDHYVDGRATCTFTVYDSTGAFTFYERQQVQVKDENDNLEFAGVVQSVETVTIPGTDKKFHSISAADFTAILGWRLVDYAAEDTLAGDAVRAIMVEFLASEGITEGYIESGELLTQIAIGNKSALEGYQKLAEACNFVCYLDYNLKLYFHARSLYAAPWSITDGADVLVESFQVKRCNDNYRNSETIIGGYEETDLLTETFATDGISKSFPLGFAVSRVATVTFTPSGGSPDVLTVGVKGYDSGGGFEVYFANKSETVTFEAAPVVGSCTVEYYGLWKAKSKAEDLSAQATNAARQGFGSGIIEHITTDESLASITAAGEYANAKILQYAVDGIQVSFKTRREGLAAGTLLHIEYGGLDDDFLITHVGLEAKDGDVVFSVEAVYGPIQVEWETFLNQSFQAASAISFGVEETSGITKLYNFHHHYLTADRPNLFTTAYPAVSDGMTLNSAYDPMANSSIDAFENSFLENGSSEGILVSDDSWPCFEPTDRAEYIEFWLDSTCVFRAQHTSVPNETNNVSFYSFSFISPTAFTGDIDEVVFFGGDSATISYGSGVEIYRAAFVRTKTALESYQLNMQYVNGA